MSRSGHVQMSGGSYQDKGEVIEAGRGRHLVVTPFTPLFGRPNEPDNYQTLTYEQRLD
jgi:hypothetical protein